MRELERFGWSIVVCFRANGTNSVNSNRIQFLRVRHLRLFFVVASCCRRSQHSRSVKKPAFGTYVHCEVTLLMVRVFGKLQVSERQAVRLSVVRVILIILCLEYVTPPRESMYILPPSLRRAIGI